MAGLNQDDIIVIAASGGAVLFIVLTILVVLCLRVRQRRRLLHTDEAGERRLSGFPGGHSSCIETDMINESSQENGSRRSRLFPYRTSSHAWAIVASHDSLPRQSVLSSLPKAWHPKESIATDDCHPPRLSWPLPRRLTRSKAPSNVPDEPLPLSPITERSTVGDKSPNIACLLDQKTSSGYFGESAQHYSSRVGDYSLSNKGVGGLATKTTSSEVGLALPMRPKSDMHRSWSSGALIGSPKSNTRDNSGQPETYRPTTKIEPANKFQLARSVSLCSQVSEKPPLEPIPRLPAGFRKAKPIRSPENSPGRNSVMSAATEASSILNDKDSLVGSNPETDFTSMSSHPVFSGSSQGLRIYDGGSISWDPSQMLCGPTSPGPSSTASVRPQLTTQRSYQASFEQYSLPRSRSSGLSTSLLDKFEILRTQSNASQLDRLSRELSLERAHPDKAILCPSGSNVNRQRFSSIEREMRSLAPTESPACYSGNTITRVSTSDILDFADGKGSPVRGRPKERPSSIATSNPVAWRSEPSWQHSKRSGKSGTKKGHRRQNCIRMSIPLPQVISTVFAPTIEEPEQEVETAPIKKSATSDLCNGRADAATEFKIPLPPNSIFDPRLERPPSPLKQLPSNIFDESPVPAQVPTATLDSSPDCTPWTPSKKPSSRRDRSATSKISNRHKTIFDLPNVTKWPIPPGTPDASDREDGIPFQAKSKSKLNLSKSNPAISTKAPLAASRPNSFVFSSFPNPPITTQQQFQFPVPLTSSTSASPIRSSSRLVGPRAAPSRFRSPVRRSVISQHSRSRLSTTGSTSPIRDTNHGEALTNLGMGLASTSGSSTSGNRIDVSVLGSRCHGPTGTENGTLTTGTRKLNNSPQRRSNSPGKYPGQLASKDVRATVMLLRRMDSQLSQLDASERKTYVGMGHHRHHGSGSNASSLFSLGSFAKGDDGANKYSSGSPTQIPRNSFTLRDSTFLEDRRTEATAIMNDCDIPEPRTTWAVVAATTDDQKTHSTSPLRSWPLATVASISNPTSTPSSRSLTAFKPKSSTPTTIPSFHFPPSPFVSPPSPTPRPSTARTFDPRSNRPGINAGHTNQSQPQLQPHTQQKQQQLWPHPLHVQGPRAIGKAKAKVDTARATATAIGINQKIRAMEGGSGGGGGVATHGHGHGHRIPAGWKARPEVRDRDAFWTEGDRL
ncbi:hypothetical protein MMC09_001079 [Bachmanniomyces sp. S44760]|nr:hypothetical protein [Bachmanniomyces sp. S44760]